MLRENRALGRHALLKPATKGNDEWAGDRPSRRYPPMLETHPYLKRDDGDRREAIAQIDALPDEPNLSEVIARKRIVGQIAKREEFQDNLPPWFRNMNLSWQPINSKVKSWVAEFEYFLNREENRQLSDRYYAYYRNPEEARSLLEIGNASLIKGFVAYIYADGNNMGGYIQKEIKTPEDYQQFSEDIFKATEQAVDLAFAQHLQPHRLEGITDSDKERRNGKWVHPFEILTIGGDDVLLIVPADKALAIAQTIGEEF